MALREHYECRLKDGKLLNFDCRCNDFHMAEGMFVFMAKNPQTNVKIILEVRNSDEISYVKHEYPADFYDAVMNEKAPEVSDQKIITPDKQIITP